MKEKDDELNKTDSIPAFFLEFLKTLTKEQADELLEWCDEHIECAWDITDVIEATHSEVKV